MLCSRVSKCMHAMHLYKSDIFTAVMIIELDGSAVTWCSNENCVFKWPAVVVVFRFFICSIWQTGFVPYRWHCTIWHFRKWICTHHAQFVSTHRLPVSVGISHSNGFNSEGACLTWRVFTHSHRTLENQWALWRKFTILDICTCVNNISIE